MHLQTNAKVDGTLSVQVHETRDECEGSCAAAAAIGDAIMALPDTVYKLGITAEPVCMCVNARICDEYIGKGD